MAPAMRGALKLRIAGGAEAREHEIAPGRSACVGCEQGVEIRIDDPSACDRHAIVSERDGRWIITDLGSKHNMFTHGQA